MKIPEVLDIWRHELKPGCAMRRVYRVRELARCAFSCLWTRL